MTRRNMLVGLVALGISACGPSMGVGSGPVDNLASTRIRTTSAPAVRKAVLNVFGGQGFLVLSESANSVTFSKRGGRGADLAWKTVGNSSPVMIRPTVSWRAYGAEEMWVGCQVDVAQASTTFGETVRQPIAAGKGAYNGMLREVKKQVEKGR